MSLYISTSYFLGGEGRKGNMTLYKALVSKFCKIM